MTNQNENTRKPVFQGDLPQQEYDAVVVRAELMAQNGTLPPSVRVTFLIDFPETVAFVSGFMNQTFKSGDKTATWLKNLGIAVQGNVTPIDQLRGKHCKIYVVPGKKAWNQKLGREVTYPKIAALTPANSVIPQAVQPAQPVQQAPVAQPIYATPQANVVQPVVRPMTQPVQNNPFVNQTVVPQTQTVAPQTYSVPQGNSMAAQLAQVANQAQATTAVNYSAPAQAVPVQPAPVQQPVAQPVAQPLPSTTVSLDF